MAATAEDRFRAVFEHAAIGMGRVGFDDGIWIEVNDAVCRMLGYTRAELLSTPWPQITYPEDLDLDLIPFRRMAAGELDSYTVEKRFIRKERSLVWARLTLSLVRDALGEPDCEIAIIEDITGRKRTEAALQESEAKYRSLFLNVTECVSFWELVHDDHGRIATWRLVDANPPVLRVWGKSLESVQGKAMDEILGPGATERHLAGIERMMADGVPQSFEEYFPAIDKHLQFSLIPVCDRFIVTGADITSVKRAALHLEEANTRLVEADRRKDEFLAVLSHELRNPLAPIRNSVHILARAAPGGEQATQALEVLGRQVVHMTRLIDDLLDVTRISRGKITLQREPLDLAELARAAAEDHRELFDARGVQLSIEGSRAPVLVDGDRVRLSQVVGNLLDNAVKFTPAGGSATLCVEASDDGRAIVRVRDTGAGIPTDWLQRVFEPFVQGEQTLDRSGGGLGLGLALVKGLAEMHGGAVCARSEGPGKGSELVLTLPLRAPEEDHPAIADLPSTAARPRRILIIEDNEDAAETLKELFELDGHEVQVALSGPDGLGRARAFRPEVVFCDIGLPGMNGYDVARAFRADDALRAIPLIALSGYASSEDEAKAAGAGFDRHVAKPPDLDVLERVLVELP